MHWLGISIHVAAAGFQSVNKMFDRLTLQTLCWHYQLRLLQHCGIALDLAAVEWCGNSAPCRHVQEWLSSTSSPECFCGRSKCVGVPQLHHLPCVGQCS